MHCSNIVSHFHDATHCPRQAVRAVVPDCTSLTAMRSPAAKETLWAKSPITVPGAVDAGIVNVIAVSAPFFLSVHVTVSIVRAVPIMLNARP